jgi:hypothetical protein
MNGIFISTLKDLDSSEMSSYHRVGYDEEVLVVEGRSSEFEIDFVTEGKSASLCLCRAQLWGP